MTDYIQFDIDVELYKPKVKDNYWDSVYHVVRGKDWDRQIVWEYMAFHPVVEIAMSTNSRRLVLFEAERRDPETLKTVTILRPTNGEVLLRLSDDLLVEPDRNQYQIQKIADSFENGEGWPAIYPIGITDEFVYGATAQRYVVLSSDRRTIHCHSLNGKLEWSWNPLRDVMSVKISEDNLLLYYTIYDGDREKEFSLSLINGRPPSW